MEQRRLELTLTRLQSALQEKISQIYALQQEKDEYIKQLNTLTKIKDTKLEFFQMMKQYAELCIEGELLERKIEQNTTALNNIKERTTSNEQKISNALKTSTNNQKKWRLLEIGMIAATTLIHSKHKQDEELHCMLQEDIQMHQVESRMLNTK